MTWGCSSQWRSRSGKGRSGGKMERRSLPARSPLEIAQAAFCVCARCSYFLAAYRAHHGLEHVRAAAEAGDSAWLELVWDRETRELLHKSFGGHTDEAVFDYSVSCPECHRIYLYHAAEAGETTFQVEVQPSARR